MFPFIGIGMRGAQKNIVVKIHSAVEKLNKNQLTIEDILDDDDLTNELRSITYSQLMNILNNENMKKLIEYVIKNPDVDEHKRGYKYPFNACEILCSDNVFVIDKYFENFDEELEFQDSVDQIKDEGKNTMASFGRSSILFDQNFSSHQIEDQLKNLNLTEEIQLGTENATETPTQNPSTPHDPKEDVFDINSTDLPNGISNEIETCLKEKKLKYTLIDFLFNFLDAQEDLNFVLSGYFGKIFENLYNKRKNILIPYLLKENPNLVDKLLKHLNRKSISECLFIIFMFYSKDFDSYEYKKEILIKLIDSLMINNDEERIENSCDIIFEILQNRIIYYIIAKNKEILNSIFLLPKNVITACKGRVFKFIIKFLEQIIKDISPNTKGDEDASLQYGEQTSNEIELTRNDSKLNELEMKNYLDLFEAIYENLDFIIEDFLDTDQTTQSNIQYFSTYEKETKVLGNLKLYQSNYIKNILELCVCLLNNPTLSKLELVLDKINKLFEKILTNNVFKKIMELLFAHEMNNFYQIIVDKIFSLIVHKNISEVYINKIFPSLSELILLHLFKSEFEFKSGNKILSGYYSTLCNIAIKINSSENASINKIILESDEWQYLMSILVKKVHEIFNKFLLYDPKQSLIHNFRSNDNSQTTQELKTGVETHENPPFKEFTQVLCYEKFQLFKEKRSKILKDIGKFDVVSFIQEESIDLRKSLEESNLATSIHLEDKSDNDQNNLRMSENIDSDSSTELYNDNIYYWKDYKVNVDLSEL